MLKFSPIACLAVWSAVLPLAANAELLRDNDRIMISGDSITAAGSFAVDIETYLIACSGKKDVQVFSAGHYGERMSHFCDRMRREAACYGPSLMILAYGINDLSGRYCDEKFSGPYSKSVAAIADYLKSQKVRLLLSSPTCHDTDSYKSAKFTGAQANEELKKLARLNQKLAGEFNFEAVDTTSLFFRTMQAAKAVLGQKYFVGGHDGTHPGGNGHLILAYSILRQLGEKGDIAEIVMDLESGKVAASTGHQVVSSEPGKAEITSMRYPYCFMPPRGVNEATILPYLPFQQDLNRFILKIVHPASAKYQVVWNGRSKVFTKSDLERGVNLAAEFLDNPFNAQFAAIHKASAIKKQREMYICRTWMASLQDIPEGGEEAKIATEIKHVLAELVKANDGDHDALKKLVTPVRHTITLRPAL